MRGKCHFFLWPGDDQFIFDLKTLNPTPLGKSREWGKLRGPFMKCMYSMQGISGKDKAAYWLVRFLKDPWCALWAGRLRNLALSSSLDCTFPQNFSDRVK